MAESARPTKVTAEEMRCLKLLEQAGGCWVWYMTDQEYRTAQQAIERRKAELRG
jgi:hypothetical protein